MDEEPQEDCRRRYRRREWICRLQEIGTDHVSLTNKQFESKEQMIVG